ncbi:MAG: hypothetical protein JF591_15815 [Lysobacter sp.]|nr:hypothetical protein [Lysobacter sp.]
MAYFSLPALTLPSYRFDYHSHFGGILPVDNPQAVATDPIELKVVYQVPSEVGTVDANVTVRIVKGQQLTLAGLFGGALDEQQPERGALSLFLKALMLMEEDNPLAKLAGSPNHSRYERGECIAEDIFIACVCLADQLKLDVLRDAVATSPVLYSTVRNALQQLALDPPPGQKRPIEALMPLLRYFNAKIYSASKYTPFDDAYRMRSFAMKKLRAEPGGKERYLQWMAMSLLYLEQEGIGYAQLAMGEDEIRIANAVLGAYNASRSTRYKLLAHTATVYAGDNALENELNTKILPLFLDPSLTEVIGIDLLGTENKVGNYGELFSFLAGQLGTASVPLTQSFGSAEQPRALQLVSHIHCGEGMGVSSDNRSAIGYAIAYSRFQPGSKFYRAYADYVLACRTAAKGRRDENLRGTVGTNPHKDTGVSGLFDEMFRNDSLTIDGLTLRRYDGNSARTQELVAYAGKRNMMALCEALDQPVPAQAPATQTQSYYQLLTGPSTLLGLPSRAAPRPWPTCCSRARRPCRACWTRRSRRSHRRWIPPPTTPISRPWSPRWSAPIPRRACGSRRWRACSTCSSTGVRTCWAPMRRAWSTPTCRTNSCAACCCWLTTSHRSTPPQRARPVSAISCRPW